MSKLWGECNETKPGIEKKQKSLILAGWNIWSFLLFGQCSSFCLYSDLITEWLYLFLDLSWSQNGHVWCWYSVRLCSTGKHHRLSMNVKPALTHQELLFFFFVTWLYIIWSLIFSDCFSLDLLFFHYALPFWPFFLSLQKATYISNQPFLI